MPDAYFICSLLLWLQPLLWLCLLVPSEADESAQTVEMKKEIKTAIDDLSTLLSFVTLLNVFYCLMVLYGILLALYAVILIKRSDTKKKLNAMLMSIKVNK